MEISVLALGCVPAGGCTARLLGLSCGGGFFPGARLRREDAAADHPGRRRLLRCAHSLPIQPRSAAFLLSPPTRRARGRKNMRSPAVHRSLCFFSPAQCVSTSCTWAVFPSSTSSRGRRCAVTSIHPYRTIRDQTVSLRHRFFFATGKRHFWIRDMQTCMCVPRARFRARRVASRSALGEMFSSW